MILLAQSALRNVESSVDFIGHIGGDDFIALFHSDDWENRCHSIVDMFNEAARPPAPSDRRRKWPRSPQLPSAKPSAETSAALGGLIADPGS
ncbi:hypothetical protein [Cognatiluteimonas profundi]|uniref:hypothetical protein n=1 Tax=Cognatiluteimonas profundi TaxID=2594501 RepID=UPI001E5AB882|nr:hypothetical protein [Lysobacter profundi]